MGHWRVFSGMVLLAIGVATAPAQIDNTKRELIQLGYNQPLEGHGPLAAYGFYYLNLPQFLRTNLTLRMAVAPVYLDAELGISQAITRNTDLGIGIAGGGFADSYDEVRQGKFLQEESFTGHGGGASASIYHLFNPQQRVPLYAVIRGEAYSSFFERSDDTSHTFELPDNYTTFALRTGLRFGGREPLISPDFAMELSVWHELLARTESGTYGFNDDREVEETVNVFWGRALLAYTLPKCKHTFAVSLTAGTSADPDRFSAYRLGGFLPLSAEFPLSLPGYYFQEI
ncbi:MAG TPA: hypothetical protein VNZ22_11510, partial [Bacillota bacterium]|nr:hypothetical protein [Bacillota bacterium]